MPEFDNETSLREAEAKMPFERVIRECGYGPKNENWKTFDCPFCKKEDKAGVFAAHGGGTKLFKCLSDSCDANEAMPVVKFFKKVRGISSDRDAFIEYLKLTGVWREKEKSLPKESQPEVTNGDGQALLRQFYSRLMLRPLDERRISDKRGLNPATSAALGFKSNLKSNRRLLLELAKTFAWEELKSSGLWLPPAGQKRRRPNSQFCGYVQLARRPKNRRKHADDKMVWGWCDEGWCKKCEHACKGEKCFQCGGKLKSADAILIPYFNGRGELMALRPHKGGAPEGTAASALHIYIPRTPQKITTEHFPVVVITEGEFKAAALWQILGAGREDGREPIGVVALPGIYFARHLGIRDGLEEWLRTVNCRRVIVAYDFEEKGNPQFGDAYQPEERRRFDSQTWARYLATSLSKKLHIRGEVALLPWAWQENGKADWDGALAQLGKANASSAESGVAA